MVIYRWDISIVTIIYSNHLCDIVTIYITIYSYYRLSMRVMINTNNTKHKGRHHDVWWGYHINITNRNWISTFFSPRGVGIHPRNWMCKNKHKTIEATEQDIKQAKYASWPEPPTMLVINAYKCTMKIWIKTCSWCLRFSRWLELRDPGNFWGCRVAAKNQHPKPRNLHGVFQRHKVVPQLVS